MGGIFSRRFTTSEMAEIRRLQREEDRFGVRLIALLGKFLGRIPFAEDVLSAWYCTRDPATPRRVRVTLMLALGYFVLPLDAIPDILPILGFTDDAAVIAAAIAAVAGSISEQHRTKARETIKGL